MNRLGKSSGIVNGKFVDECSVIDAGPAFDGVQFVRMRSSAAVEPELLVIADGVDDERVSFPVSDGMAPPRRQQIVRMFGLIHMYDTMVSGIAGLMQKVNLGKAFRCVRHREFPWVWIHTGNAHRQAGGIGFLAFFAAVSELLRPRQQWKFAG